MIKGHVYILKNDGINYYKIGHSSNPLKRIENIRTSNPYLIEVVGVYPIIRSIETEMFLHQRLRKYRVRLEWFNLPENILLDIKKSLSSMETVCDCAYCKRPVLDSPFNEEIDYFIKNYANLPSPIQKEPPIQKISLDEIVSIVNNPKTGDTSIEVRGNSNVDLSNRIIKKSKMIYYIQEESVIVTDKFNTVSYNSYRLQNRTSFKSFKYDVCNSGETEMNTWPEIMSLASKYSLLGGSARIPNN